MYPKTTEVVCKYCVSKAVSKYGKYGATQLYWCKICARKFKGDDTLFHMKVSPEYISSALALYYTGLSINDICLHFRDAKGYHPSKSVVFQWVDKYTDMAVDHFRQYQPQVGDVWAEDETMLDLDKKHKVWFWDIIDADTRFLIASRVSETRTTKDAQSLMETAKRVTGKSPKKIISDKLRAYWDGIELTFGADTEHVMSSPFAGGEDSTALIERWHSILKERTKVMKAFRNVDTLIQFTDGFLVYYNYLRPHESLKGKTPAEAAGIAYDVKSWQDVCRLPVTENRSFDNVFGVTPKARATRVGKRKLSKRVGRRENIPTSLGEMR
ncbi:transposase [Chloroflexota bacterium]